MSNNYLFSRCKEGGQQIMTIFQAIFTQSRLWCFWKMKIQDYRCKLSRLMAVLHWKEVNYKVRPQKLVLFSAFALFIIFFWFAVGWLEVVLDRKVMNDDLHGLGQGIYDNKITPSNFRLLLENFVEENKQVSTHCMSAS